MTIKRRGARGLVGASMHLQLDEWAYDEYFANVIIDEDTEKSLEYRYLVKMEKYHDTWTASFANELGRLAQGIHEVPVTNTIFFIPKSDIPRYRRKGAPSVSLLNHHTSIQRKRQQVKPLENFAESNRLRKK